MHMDWLKRIVLLAGLLTGLAHALYGPDKITAFRVANNKIVVDGKPDSVWREIAGLQGGTSTIAFNDYSKIVLLGSDALRNANPQDHYQAPDNGSVVFMAAFNDSALFFYFIVRENNSFIPSVAGCGAADLWKAHAAEVYVDPSVFSSTNYTAYFSTDAGDVSYGTSTKTVQMAKPALPAETREYFRDRTVNNRFALRYGTEAKAVSAIRTTGDPLTYGIEMRIPFPTPSDYTAGKSMFISWGYNHFPDTGRASCSAEPIAYRWAKHVKDYADSTKKPPGWRATDKVHDNPLRSWDGWGQFTLENNSPLSGSKCRGWPLTETDWNLPGSGVCKETATHARIVPRTGPSPWSITVGPALPSGTAPFRDIRGRFHAGKGYQLLVEPLPVPASRN